MANVKSKTDSTQLKAGEPKLPRVGVLALQVEESQGAHRSRGLAERRQHNPWRGDDAERAGQVGLYRCKQLGLLADDPTPENHQRRRLSGDDVVDPSRHLRGEGLPVARSDGLHAANELSGDRASSAESLQTVVLSALTETGKVGHDRRLLMTQLPGEGHGHAVYPANQASADTGAPDREPEVRALTVAVHRLRQPGRFGVVAEHNWTAHSIGEHVLNRLTDPMTRVACAHQHAAIFIELARNCQPHSVDGISVQNLEAGARQVAEIALEVSISLRLTRHLEGAALNGLDVMRLAKA